MRAKSPKVMAGFLGIVVRSKIIGCESLIVLIHLKSIQNFTIPVKQLVLLQMIHSPRVSWLSRTEQLTSYCKVNEFETNGLEWEKELGPFSSCFKLKTL